MSIDGPGQDQLRQVAQTVRMAWLMQPEVVPVISDLRHYGEGAELASCPTLRHLLTCLEAADAFVSAWIGNTCVSLSRHPLMQSDFAFQDSRGIAAFQLAEFGTAELSILAYEPRDGPPNGPTETAQFAAIDKHEICLAGRAKMVCATRGIGGSSAPISLARRSLGRGDRIVLRGARQTKALEDVESRLVVLRLSRIVDRAYPVQEIRLSDGAIVHQASGDWESSRKHVAMSLLARMQRKDAIPAMADLAQEGDDQMRWEAMRHCLSLDTGEGVRLLAQMARASNDSLSKPAAGLLNQLYRTHPQLRQVEAQPCPA